MQQFDYAVVHDFEGATRNFEQIAAAGMYVGSGAPTFQAQKGNWYFRTDTGASGSGVMYRNTANGSNWVDVSTYGLQLLSPQKLQVQQGSATVTSGTGVNAFDITLPIAWPTNHFAFFVGLDPQTTNVAGNYTIGSRTNGLTKGRFQFGSSAIQNWGVEWFSLGN